MGGMTRGKCKDRQNKISHIQKIYKNFQGGYGRLKFGYVYTSNGLLQRMCEFKRTDLEVFFTSLLNNLSIDN
jgi:hypothetical protein